MLSLDSTLAFNQGEKFMDKIIEFKNVSKTYDSETHALNDINISIEKGEFVFIVGASGAGKSTFLKLIMREESPSAGTITVNGTDVTNLKRKKVPYLRRNMGIVFQDFRLIEKMTIYDNVAFAMRAIGASPAQVKERVPYILGLVGLSHKLKSRPSELSGGEQQRVSLARALVNKPAIIIADEPTGNIDPEMSFEIIELLAKVNEEYDTTILVVTHEHELVKQFNKRVIEIEKGNVINDTKEPLPDDTEPNEEISFNETEEPENEESEDTETAEPESEETESSEAIELEDEAEQTEESENIKDTNNDDSEDNNSEETTLEEEITEPEAVSEEEETVQEAEGSFEENIEPENNEKVFETAEEILESLASRTNSDIDETSVDEVLAELREQKETKGGES